MKISVVCLCLVTLLDTGCTHSRKENEDRQARADFEHKVKCSEAAVRAEQYFITKDSEAHSTIDNSSFSPIRNTCVAIYQQRNTASFSMPGSPKDDPEANTTVIYSVVDPLTFSYFGPPLSGRGKAGQDEALNKLDKQIDELRRQ